MPDTPGPCWTAETVLTHLLALRSADQDAVRTAFSAQKGAVDAALAAADRAVLKAEAASEKRFEAVNEFRAALSDQQSTFIARTEVDAKIYAATKDIEALQKEMDRLRAERAGIRGGWGYAVGLVGFVIAIVALINTFAGRQ